MIALKHILVPTDFSPPSSNALRYARAFAETFNATLHLLHVVDDASFAYAWMAPEGGVLPPGFDPISEAEKQAQDRLEQSLTPQDRQRFSARLVLKVGSPFVEVVRYARTENVDLIVMARTAGGPSPTC